MASPAIISTYTLLKNAIEDHLNRSDIDDEGVSAMAIDLAEAKLNRVVDHPNRMKRNDTFTVDSQYETVPSDFWAVKRFALNTTPTQFLEYLSPEEIAVKRQSMSASGRPVYYSVSANTSGGHEFEFLPTPGTSYTGLLVYVAAIPPLASNSTNWLLNDHPDVYLYASMVEAEAWVQNDERSMYWSSKLDRALNEMRVSGQRYAGTPIARVKPFGA